MLNPQWLNTFIVLADTGSFTRTAEQCFMTQPGVSQHIKKLEQQLGQPLLTRIGKRFELTQAGLFLLQYARQQQQQEGQLRQQLQQDDEHKGVCRFACSGSLAVDLYPLFLSRQRQYPQLILELEAAPNQRILQAIENDAIDVGIMTQASDSPLLEQQKIGSDVLALFIPADLPADSPDSPPGTINFEQLQQLGFINHPDGEHYARHLLAANFPDDFRGIQQLKPSGYVNQLSQILLPVSEGLGFTVLPERVLNSFGGADAVQSVPLPEAVKEDLYLSYKKYRPLPGRFDWFIQTLKQHLNQ